MTDEVSEKQHLMRINVGDKRLKDKGKLLLIGSCMDRFPEIVKDFSERAGGQAVLHICLEETHVNQVGFKIGSIVKYSGITEITALTVDGSPHCVQLHYVIDDVKQHFAPEIETKHFVVEKGEVHEISSDAVKKSRHLSKIQKMIS
ncbi:MAG: 4Fe-4S ferredoxin [Candidatus Thorarchaeota archaeon]|nr:MAG: 4Fe-4S ferredoxin [Candidatus Thorarchaeota archaeon]